MTAREWLDGLDLLHGAIYRGIEDQRRLTMEHDAIPELVARLRAVLDLADELGNKADEARAASRALYGAERPALAEAHGYKADAYGTAADRLRAAVEVAL